MQEKQNKGKVQIIFASILLATVFVVELYAMINLSQQFLIIGILGIVFLVCLYILISAIMQQIQLKEERKEEQYDSIFKSEKASYLLQKKYFEEIEDQLKRLEKSTKIPIDEIIGTQKGIGKVIVNRSRENAEAVMNSNDQLFDKVSEFEEILQSNNDKNKEVIRQIGEENIQHILQKQQEIMMSLKDMELRLNTAIMQSQKIVAQTPMYAAPMAAPAQVAPAPVMQAVEPQFEPAVQPESIPEATPEPAVVEEAIPVVEEPVPVIEETVPVVEEPMTEEAIPMAEEPMPMAEEAIPVAEEPMPMAEETVPAVEEPSDPNKQLSPDEIAALFASAEAEAIPPAKEEAAPQEAAEPEVSDPNKQLSPDEIAALFASAEAEAIPPAKEEAAPQEAAEPEASDPNKQLSPDEIAALFANLGGEVAPEEEVAPEPQPQPQVDLSDPNKQLSADEIAALFASMGT